MDAEIIMNELNVEGTTFLDPIRPNIIVAGSGEESFIFNNTEYSDFKNKFNLANGLIIAQTPDCLMCTNWLNPIRNTLYCIQRNGDYCLNNSESSYGQNDCIYIFEKKIPKKFTKLKMEIETVVSPSYSGANPIVSLYFANSNRQKVNVGIYCTIDLADCFNFLIYLCRNDLTPEQINSQLGVTINSTNNLNLSRQTVEVDLSKYNVDQDYYLCMHSNLESLYIYNIDFE